jgi:prepilin-type processing-associated H-X9-DG protein
VKSKRLIEALAAMGILLVLAAVLFPLYGSTGHGYARKTHCLSNGKQLGLGMLLYASDYDERLPLAARWLDDAYPYVKNGRLACPMSPTKQYGYAMHESLSEAALKEIEEPAGRMMLFESIALIPNAAGDEALLPNPGRHAGSNTIVYADGHAKGVKSPEHLAR